VTIFYAEFLAAQSFTPTAPAKLATIGPITPQLEAGSGGSLSLYVKHLNDRLSDWSSLADVVGSWSLIGTLTHNTPTGAISFTPGPNEQVRFRLAFDDSGGAPPALLSLSMPWTSDVVSPDAPNIALVTPVVPDGGTVGYRADFALPATSRHVIVEGRLNAGSWLLFTDKAKMEASGTYMKFRGNLDAVELSGERNETHLSFAKGLSAGDSVEIRIAAEDDVGNRSAFTASDAVTLEAPVNGAPPVLFIEDTTIEAGGTGTARVHLIGIAPTDVTADLASADGTALAPGDYTAISQQISFAGDPGAGHRYQDITVNATGSAPQGSTVGYTVTLSNVVGASLERATADVVIQTGAAIVAAITTRLRSRYRNSRRSRNVSDCLTYHTQSRGRHGIPRAGDDPRQGYPRSQGSLAVLGLVRDEGRRR